MNKKGFTLIELLAVIIILAVIALIATPTIMNAIDSAKKGAVKDAAYSCMDAVEFYIVKTLQDDDSANDYPLSGEFVKDSSNMNDLNIKGNNPTELDLMINNSQVISGNIIFGEYTVIINDGIVTEVNASIN